MAKRPAPEDVFHYVYAILYAPTYRAKYAEFLRTDFPRVPFTKDRDVFAQVAALGARLTALHLLDSPELDTPTCRFEGDGDAVVARTQVAGLSLRPGRPARVRQQRPSISAPSRPRSRITGSAATRSATNG